MSKINILNMDFEEDNYPDFGSIAVDREGDLVLLGQDIHKLQVLLTREVCVGIYNVPTFAFKSGDIAFAMDVSRLFMYENTTDTWYEVEG